MNIEPIIITTEKLTWETMTEKEQTIYSTAFTRGKEEGYQIAKDDKWRIPILITSVFVIGFWLYIIFKH